MKIKFTTVTVAILFWATVGNCGPNSGVSPAFNPLYSDPTGAGALARQRAINEQYLQEQAQIAAENQRIYSEQVNSLNQLRQHLEDLQSVNAGGFFRVVHGVTNYIYDGGWNYVSGKVLQTLPDGVLVKPEDGTDIFVEGYPFQTVDDQLFAGCMSKDDGVYSFTAVSGGRRTVKKMSYGNTVTPSPELLEKEINTTKDEIQNHPLVLKAKADAAAKQKAVETKKSSQARVLKMNQELADKGDAYGLLRMAERYRDGDCVEKDLQKAKVYFMKATDAGSLTAAEELGKLNETVVK